MDLPLITPLILTPNEAANIARKGEPPHWAPRIVVLDSGSSDETFAMASGFPNVAVHTRPFDDHTVQWNSGLNLITTEWVVALVADYVTDTKFADELRSLKAAPDTNAFFADFIYCISGKPLRGTLYP